jgi:hypothetical protein
LNSEADLLEFIGPFEAVYTPPVACRTNLDEIKGKPVESDRHAQIPGTESLVN